MCNSKVIRSLSLLLLFSLFLTGFGSVNVSAASDNLIDPDLRNWETYDDKTFVNYFRGYYQLRVDVTDGETVDLCVGAIYDLSSLSSGYSYKLNFHTVLPSEMGVSDSRVYNQFNNGYLLIGLASYDSSNNTPYFVEGCYVSITAENYSKYFGYDTTYTFTMPNVENPCICILYSGVGNSVSTYFGFKNFSLIDTEAEKEESFLGKIFDWFAQRFDAIGNFFTTLTSDINNGLAGVLDGLSAKLTALKEGIQNKIEELKTSLVELREALIDGIKGLFVPSEDYIFTWKANLQQLFQEHLGIIYTSGDLITTLLEKTSDIVFNAPDTYGLTIPEVTFELPDGTIVPLFEETDISFDFMEIKIFKTMYGFYGIALYILFGSLEAKYALRVYRKVMAN